MIRLPTLTPLPKWGQFSLEVGASLLFCLALHLIRPEILIDDAGFILRYLDNFQEGCFYCFNVSDGPVFGLSGFVHGLVAAGFTLVGCGTKTALLISNYLGLFLSSWLLLRILSNLQLYALIKWGIWVAVLVANKAFLYIATTGMETPIHLAIVLAALLAFWQEKPRWMWAFLALSAISKLDAVPIIVVVAIIYLLPRFREMLSWKSGVLKNLFLWGVLPVITWIVFSTLVFGSPLPQSAYAKTYLLFHREDHWFPFFQNYTNSSFKLAFFFLFMSIWLFQLGRIIRQKAWERLPLTLFGWAFFATLLLYYFYNPGERMLWYYALPNFLLLLQTLISLHELTFLLPGNWRSWFMLLFLSGFISINFWKLNTGVKEFNDYLFTVEKERENVGHYIANQAAPGDTLMASHGLNSHPFPGYVIDLTGLNSRLATNYALDREKLIQDHRPHWIVDHGWAQDVEIIARNGYSLDTIFHNISTSQFPGWWVFRRSGPDQVSNTPTRIALSAIDMEGSGEGNETNQLVRASASVFNFHLPPLKGTVTLSFAIPVTDPLPILEATLPLSDTGFQTRQIHPLSSPLASREKDYFINIEIPWEIDQTLPNPTVSLRVKDSKTIEICSPTITIEN